MLCFSLGGRRQWFDTLSFFFSPHIADSVNLGIAVLTLNRPATKNALGKQMLEEFRSALTELRFDKCVAGSFFARL